MKNRPIKWGGFFVRNAVYRAIIEFLLEAGLHVDSTDDKGIRNPPLGVAVSYGYKDIAALCLQWGQIFVPGTMAIPWFMRQ